MREKILKEGQMSSDEDEGNRNKKMKDDKNKPKIKDIIGDAKRKFEEIDSNSVDQSFTSDSDKQNDEAQRADQHQQHTVQVQINKDEVMKELKEEQAKILSERFEEYSKEFFALAKKVETQLKESDHYVRMLHNELEQELKKRTKDLIPIVEEISGLTQNLREREEDFSSQRTNLEYMAHVIRDLNEIVRVQVTMNAQEDADKNSISLIGLKLDELNENRTKIDIEIRKEKQPQIATRLNQDIKALDVAMVPQHPIIRLDEDCISCSKSIPSVIDAFKMACLNYHPSQVKYNGKFYDREDLF